MSPRAVQYNADSVIYFKGDLSDRIFILKEGKVSLSYLDLETGQEVHELIQTGEFFGVKSALGKYPREETAVTLQKSALVVFSVPEFEQLAMQNTRIIMKMLKVFSNQLRKIHKRVQNLIATEKQESPETGLFGIGEYYFKKRLYPQALYAFRQYLTYYPSGKYTDQAVKNSEVAERNCEQYGAGQGAAPVSGVAEDTGKPSGGRALSGVAKAYYNAVSLFSQQRFQEALSEFREIVDDGSDLEYVAKSEYEIGRCLFSLEQFDACVRHFSSLIQKYPKHPDLTDALYHVARSYEQLAEKGRALGIYRKIMTMTAEDDPLYRKAKRAVRQLEGSSV